MINRLWRYHYFFHYYSIYKTTSLEPRKLSENLSWFGEENFFDMRKFWVDLRCSKVKKLFLEPKKFLTSRNVTLTKIIVDFLNTLWSEENRFYKWRIYFFYVYLLKVTYFLILTKHLIHQRIDRTRNFDVIPKKHFFCFFFFIHDISRTHRPTFMFLAVIDADF